MGYILEREGDKMSEIANGQEYLTMPEAVSLTGIDNDTLRHRILRGALPATVLREDGKGKSYGFLRTDLEAQVKPTERYVAPPPAEVGDDFISLSEVSKITGIKNGTLTFRIKRGQIPAMHVQVGENTRHYYVNKADVPNIKPVPRQTKTYKRPDVTARNKARGSGRAFKHFKSTTTPSVLSSMATSFSTAGTRDSAYLGKNELNARLQRLASLVAEGVITVTKLDVELRSV